MLKFENISLFDLGKNKTPSVKRLDVDITFHKQFKLIKKEDLGINPENLITSGSEFPQNPIPGQIFIKDGIAYKYQENKE